MKKCLESSFPVTFPLSAPGGGGGNAEARPPKKRARGEGFHPHRPYGDSPNAAAHIGGSTRALPPGTNAKPQRADDVVNEGME